MDIDFEQTLRPPPAPTAEAAAAIEDIVKRRILELRFDNVVRVVPAPSGAVAGGSDRGGELDDSKSRAGLADLYEPGAAAVAGAPAEKRARARTVRCRT